ncbi:MAG: helix-turn-helix domain-containing protein [Flavobacterium sp.]
MNRLDKDIFEQWMFQIMKRFDQTDKQLATIINKKVNNLDCELLLDNYDLCQMMHISKRTLQRYRSSGMLLYQMVNHKTYYKESDVQNFIRLHFEKFNEKKSQLPKKP